MNTTNNRIKNNSNYKNIRSLNSTVYALSMCMGVGSVLVLGLATLIFLDGEGGIEALYCFLTAGFTVFGMVCATLVKNVINMLVDTADLTNDNNLRNRVPPPLNKLS